MTVIFSIIFYFSLLGLSRPTPLSTPSLTPLPSPHHIQTQLNQLADKGELVRALATIGKMRWSSATELLERGLLSQSIERRTASYLSLSQLFEYDIRAWATPLLNIERPLSTHERSTLFQALGISVHPIAAQLVMNGLRDGLSLEETEHAISALLQWSRRGVSIPLTSRAIQVIVKPQKSQRLTLLCLLLAQEYLNATKSRLGLDEYAQLSAFMTRSLRSSDPMIHLVSLRGAQAEQALDLIAPQWGVVGRQIVDKQSRTTTRSISNGPLVTQHDLLIASAHIFTQSGSQSLLPLIFEKIINTLQGKGSLLTARSGSVVQAHNFLIRLILKNVRPDAQLQRISRRSLRIAQSWINRPSTRPTTLKEIEVKRLICHISALLDARSRRLTKLTRCASPELQPLVVKLALLALRKAPDTIKQRELLSLLSSSAQMPIKQKALIFGALGTLKPLGKRKDQMIEVLRSGLNDHDLIAGAAIKSAAQLNFTSLIPAISTRLNRSIQTQDFHTAIEAVKALSRLQGSQSIEILKSLLHSSHPELRQVVVRLLSHHTSTQAGQPVKSSPSQGIHLRIAPDVHSTMPLLRLRFTYGDVHIKLRPETPLSNSLLRTLIEKGVQSKRYIIDSTHKMLQLSLHHQGVSQDDPTPSYVRTMSERWPLPISYWTGEKWVMSFFYLSFDQHDLSLVITRGPLLPPHDQAGVMGEVISGHDTLRRLDIGDQLISAEFVSSLPATD